MAVIDTHPVPVTGVVVPVVTVVASGTDCVVVVVAVLEAVVVDADAAVLATGTECVVVAVFEAVIVDANAAVLAVGTDCVIKREIESPSPTAGASTVGDTAAGNDGSASLSDMAFLKKE